MNEDMRQIIKNLRKMDNTKRYNWLLETYAIGKNPEYYIAIHLIPHFSWKKIERQELMMYFFQKMPFSSKTPYENFLKIMPLNEFIYCLAKLLQTIKLDLSQKKMIKYHLDRVFQKNIYEDAFLCEKLEPLLESSN